MRQSILLLGVACAALALAACNNNPHPSELKERELDRGVVAQQLRDERQHQIDHVLETHLENRGAVSQGGFFGDGGEQAEVVYTLQTPAASVGAVGACIGDDGVATITLNGAGPFRLPCGSTAEPVDLTDAISDAAAKVVAVVDGAPSGAVWGVQLTAPAGSKN